MIPKPGGGERPLGIPTIRDRVVQTAVKIVIEPVLEADLSHHIGVPLVEHALHDFDRIERALLRAIAKRILTGTSSGSSRCG